MELPELIKENEELSDWLGSSLDGLKVKGDERSVIAAGCFHLAIEHHLAITTLVSKGLYGSAFAMARLLYETLVRGLWIQHCATLQQVEQYKTDKLDLKFYQLLDGVEKIHGWEQGLLSETKKQSWTAMNSFTHSGILQASRRFNGVDIQSSYTTAEIIRALKFAGSIALLTGIAVAGLVDDIKLANTMLEKAKAFKSSTAT